MAGSTLSGPISPPLPMGDTPEFSLFLYGDVDSPVDPKSMALKKLLDTATRTIQYVYDIGDDCDQSIRIVLVNNGTQGLTYQRLLKATGACPPEDYGGVGLRGVPGGPRRPRSRKARGRGPLVRVANSPPSMPGLTAASNASSGLEEMGPQPRKL